MMIGTTLAASFLLCCVATILNSSCCSGASLPITTPADDFNSTTTKDIGSMLREEYHNYESMKQLFESLQATYPHISRVLSVGKSVQGRDLLVFQITDQIDVVEPGEPMFKYVGNMHGDEAIGRELLISLIYELLSKYGKDDRITKLVDTTNIFIMPSANPDGFEASPIGSCYYSDGRQNANGVDLNRNFPDQWRASDSKNVDEMFEGRERETVLLMKWIMSNKFVLSGNLHGGAVVASYPWDDSANHRMTGQYSAAPDDKVFLHLATVYSQSHAYMHRGSFCGEKIPGGVTNGAHWYDVPGGMQDFNYLHSNCLEITIELSCCKYPPASEIKGEWEANRDSLINYIYQTHLGVKGFVTIKNDSNENENAPIEDAVILVEGIDHPINTSQYGDYWRLLMPGTYKLTAQATGFESQTKIIEVFADHVVSLNFTLEDTKNQKNRVKVGEDVVDAVAETKTENKFTAVDSSASSVSFKQEVDHEAVKLMAHLDLLLFDKKERAAADLISSLIEPPSRLFTKLHSNEDLLSEMRAVNAKCPEITSLYTIGKSVSGAPLFALLMSDRPLEHESGEPEFRYIANMHGNEMIGRELLIQLMHFLCDNYGHNEMITRLVDFTRIHLLPTMNPDGYERASTTQFYQGRENANWVDLNRNFPSMFDPSIASQYKNNNLANRTEKKRTKRGASDGKDVQPEALAVMSWTHMYPFVLSANLHGGSLVVNYPYDDNTEHKVRFTPCPDEATFQMLSKAYSVAHTKMAKGATCRLQGVEFFKDGITNGAEWYTIRGSMQDWNYMFTNTLEVTIEVGCEKAVPPARFNQFWNDNKYALLSYIGQTHKGIKGFVLDKATGRGITNGTISVEGIDHVTTSYLNGDFWRLLVPGTYWIQVSHPKYKTQRIQLTVEAGAAKIVTIYLSDHNNNNNSAFYHKRHRAGHKGGKLLSDANGVFNMSKSLNGGAAGFHRYSELNNNDDQDANEDFDGDHNGRITLGHSSASYSTSSSSKTSKSHGNWVSNSHKKNQNNKKADSRQLLFTDDDEDDEDEFFHRN